MKIIKKVKKKKKKKSKASIQMTHAGHGKPICHCAPQVFKN
jgi:hypothetical protein